MKNSNRPRIAFNLLVCLALTMAIGIPLATHGQPSKPSKPPAAPKPATADTKAKLPPAKEVIDAFVKAIGGKEAFAKINSQHAKGKFEMAAQGISGDLEVFAKRPDKMVMKVKLPPLGELLEGFDGTTAWSLNPATGPMVIEGKQFQQKREDANFDSVLHLEKDIASMETLELAEYDGKECYKVKVVKKSGKEMTEYFDTKTGLLIGYVGVQESPVGPITVSASLSDYKRFGDVLFVTKVTQRLGPISQTMTINSMEINTVDDSVFALPEQIKPLIKK